MVFYPGRETCLYERLSFLWQWCAGLSLRSIARRSGRSPDTVRRWLRWWERCGRLLRPVGSHKHRYSPRSAKNGGRDILYSEKGATLSTPHRQPYTPAMRLMAPLYFYISVFCFPLVLEARLIISVQRHINRCALTRTQLRVTDGKQMQQRPSEMCFRRHREATFLSSSLLTQASWQDILIFFLTF
ncbi:hypothetical protein E2C01_007081 [Portunus trituberculatus]|uniref:Uncharacterized protein n=1 Tax=Portunus trituberculatus TaxID=210409 RepID=A0A5B7CWW4_PORTR|nr:hypothetical protein [Portunus trituberculatus]